MAKSETKAPATTDTRHSTPATERGWTPFWNLRDEVDALFDDFYRHGLGAFRRGLPAPRALASAPSIDVIDKENEVKLIADLPGLSEADIDLRVNNSTLTLSGEKKEEFEEGDKAGDRYVSERRFGSFTRRISLPEGIDQEKIEATFRNGVLTVRLPKTREARQASRKIRIKPAS